MRKLLVLFVVSVMATSAAFAGMTTPILTPDAFGGMNLSPAADIGVFHSGALIDCVRLDWISGDQFIAPNVLHTFSDASWSQTWGSPTAALAEGDAADPLDHLFSINLTQDTTIIWSTYLNGVQQWATQWDWYQDNGYWDTYNIDDWNPGKRPPVPEPASMLLLGGGLLAAGARRFRRR